jgi:ABC-type nitrate/sulfonate/bicarbonate transport system ATPase subunit
VLLTRNAKHFLDDRLFPFHSTRGVIALDAHPANREAYETALALVSRYLLPWAEVYEDMKIKVSVDGITFRYVDWKGKVATDRVSLKDLIEGRYPVDEESATW